MADGLLGRITNLRFTAFLVVAVSAFVLCAVGRLTGTEWAMVMGAAIGAFIGAQAWENVSTFVKGSGDEAGG